MTSIIIIIIIIIIKLLLLLLLLFIEILEVVCVAMVLVFSLLLRFQRVCESDVASYVMTVVMLSPRTSLKHHFG